MKLQADYPIKLLCDLLALPRSSWYFKAAERDELVKKHGYKTMDYHE